MNVQMVAELLSQEEIPYAVLDEEDSTVRILISEDSRELFKKLAAKMGWKKIKDKSGDLYLYGMRHFLYYSCNGIMLIACCQLACRSTLNNGWVPLDRRINGQALENSRKKEKICYLGAEDELCYLTAKCVYTKKKFNDNDIERIEACMSVVDREMLIPKLEGVFFRFTDRMLQMLDRKEYADIVASLLCFAEY